MGREGYDDLYQWSVDETIFAAGTNYIIRVQQAGNPAISDRSDFAFSIVNDPPIVGTIDNVLLNEGAAFSTTLSAIDPEGGTLSAVVTGVPGATAVLDGDHFVISWSDTPDGPDILGVSVTVTDSGSPARSVIRSFGVRSVNVAPTLTVSGAPTISQGQTYTVALDAVDPGDDTIVNWRIDWGDGVVDLLPVDPSSASHVYTVASNYQVLAEATDEDGTFATMPLAVEVEAVPPLVVTSFTPDASGFQVRFDRALDPAGLNLYDSVAADLPGNVAGIPLRITGAGSFSSAHFEVHFDPALLDVAGVLDPAGGTATIDLSTAGVAVIDVLFAVPVSGANLELGRLVASVPATAPYGAKQRLDVSNVSVDDGAIAARDNDGLQVVGFVGDATFSATYSLLDVVRMQRVVLGLDTGFGNWPLLDPAILGDASGNGALTFSDATLMFREIAGIDQPQIPPRPATTPAAPLGDPDPLVSVPSNIAAQAGRDVTVPIELDTAAGLDSVQLRLAYDAQTFELLDVRKGTLTADFEWLVDASTPGLVVVDMARLTALEAGQGSLLL